MKVSEEFPSQFLEAAELGGKDFNLIIARVEKMRGVKGRDGKPFDPKVVWFEKAKKGFCLNKTNAKIIRDRLGYGDDSEQWVGKPLTIYPTTCDAFGERNVPCIRVRLMPGVSGELREVAKR